MASSQTAGGGKPGGVYWPRELLVMAITLAAGAVDALSFLALGKVFTGVMTGNLIFLGNLAAGTGTQNFVSVIVSLLLFSLGAFAATGMLRPSKVGVWTRQVTLVFAFTALTQALALVVWLLAPAALPQAVVLLLIALWAFGMGAQARGISALGIANAISTAATATVMAFAEDVEDHEKAAVTWRLGGIIASIIVGAAIGAWLVNAARAYAPIFPFVVTSLVVLIALFAPPSRPANS